MEVLIAVFTLIVLVVYCALMVVFVVLVALDPAKPLISEEAKISGARTRVNPFHERQVENGRLARP
jgi:hypothetical protein